MISILCPTRQRPKNLHRIIESVEKTAVLDPKPQFVCYVDDDDHSYDFNEFPGVKFHVAPRITMSDMWNKLIPFADGDILMLSGDDCVHHTVGWDKLVEETFAACPDKILLVFGDDGCANGKTFATHPIVHRKWTEILGYFSGPGFSCDFADAWPQDLADMIGRKKYLPFHHEHLHPVWGKAEYDKVYQESNQRLQRDRPGQRYHDTLDQRKADAAKLRAFMDPQWTLEDAITGHLTGTGA